MRILNTILRFWAVTLPHILVWLALAILATAALETFTNEGDFATLLPLFFSAIALVIALASVTFAYAKTKEKNEEEYVRLISAGEMFFYAALILIMVFLISWLTFQADNFTKQFFWYSLIKLPLGIVFGTPLAFLIFAANGISKAIRILENNLWFKIRNEIDIF